MKTTFFEACFFIGIGLVIGSVINENSNLKNKVSKIEDPEKWIVKEDGVTNKVEKKGIFDNAPIRYDNGTLMIKMRNK